MAKQRTILVDTSVLIASFRNKDTTREMLKSLSSCSLCICDITKIEMLGGCFSAERRTQTLQALDLFVLFFTEKQISEKATNLMQRYCVRQQNQPQLELPDCFIAAHAIVRKIPLLTFNKKDFDYLQGIEIHLYSH